MLPSDSAALLDQLARSATRRRRARPDPVAALRQLAQRYRGTAATSLVTLPPRVITDVVEQLADGLETLQGSSAFQEVIDILRPLCVPRGDEQ